MKKVLVIGGLGFIGYHLCRKFQSTFDVAAVDALINYVPNNYRRWLYYTTYRQKELARLGISFYVCDVRDTSFKQILVNIKPDIILNAASMPIALLADINPWFAKKDIFDSQFQLLETIRNSSIQLSKYIYISSSMVYGHFKRDDEGNIIPATEEQECLPIDSYGAFKLANEIIIRQYCQKHQIPYTIIRPSAVYGPTDCNMRVTEIFLHKGFEKGTIELDNGGLHQLDFTYIDDLTDGILLAANSEHANNQVFNLSFGKGRKIVELAQIVLQMFPSVNIENKECKPYRPNRGSLNIEKARQWLHYEPTHPLELGMQKYCNFVSEHIAQYR